MGEQRIEYRDVRGFIPETLQRGFQPFWVTPDDLLVTRVKNSLTPLTVQVSGRIWHADGSVNEFTYPYIPTSDRTTNNFTQQLEYGWLTNLYVTPGPAQTPVRGQTLVSLALARPPASGFVGKTLLAQDYLTDLNGPFWPYPRSVEGIEGPGQLRQIILTAAAGADWLTGVPGSTRWKIRGATATLVTSAAIATRQVAIVFDDVPTSTPFFTIESATTQVASVTQVYDLLPGLSLTTLIGTHQPIGIPLDLLLRFNWRIRSSTTALQAGDQWSAITLLVEEWLEG